MNHDETLLLAHKAADSAIKAKFDNGDREQPFNCGFAWVTIDGRDPLAKHCRSKTDNRDPWYGDKGYPKGWQFWTPGQWPKDAPDQYQQDMDFHVTGARAFAKVLEDAGVQGVTVGYRLD